MLATIDHWKDGLIIRRYLCTKLRTVDTLLRNISNLFVVKNNDNYNLRNNNIDYNLKSLKQTFLKKASAIQVQKLGMSYQ